MSKKVPLPSVVSPVGVAAYAWVNKPDTKFAKPGENGKYKITLVLDDTEDNRSFLSKIEAAAREIAPQMDPVVKMKRVLTHTPWSLPEDDDPSDEKLKEEFKGKIRLTANSDFKPGQIDSNRQGLPEDIFVMSGDHVRIKAMVKPFDGLGGGISLKLKTVQLINKVHRAGGVDTSGFDDIDDGYVAPTQEERDF